MQCIIVIMKFTDFGLKPKILQGVEKIGFETATEIQEKAIPFLLESTGDLIGLAQTGTGKTAAFGLPLLNSIDVDNEDTQGIILCPTRELCMQLAKELEVYASQMGRVKILAVYGGTDISKQIKSLKKGIHIVVVTPGRALALIKRKKLHLHNIRTVIFDEADEMLSMGFKEDMDKILEVTPKEKRTLLFSATMPDEIRRMSKKYMNDPHEIVVMHKNSSNTDVEHFYYEVSARKKYPALKRIADVHPDIYAIIFCRTRAETKDIAARLARDGYNTDAIHGDLSQGQRDLVMNKFRDKQITILVATDVAARGIDVQELTHVINYNIPHEMDIYVHRSGRTGRANNKGVSLILASSRDKKKLRELSKKIGRDIKQISIPSSKNVLKIRIDNKADQWIGHEPDAEFVEQYLPQLIVKFKDYSKEELIAKILHSEMKPLLAYYDQEEDLSSPSSSRDSRNSRNDRNDRRNNLRTKFSRFYINLGEKNKINAKTLLSIINKHTPNHEIEIGKIEILKAFSFFEVPEDKSSLITKSLNKKQYGSTSIIIKPVAIQQHSKKSGFKKHKSYGGGGKSKSSKSFKGSFKPRKGKKKKSF